MVLPRAGDEGVRHPFPLLASLAPVVGAVAIWAVTSSPFALIFAVLGPVIAVASLGDSRLQARKRRRQESERLLAETLEASDGIEAAHARERSRLEQLRPGALAIGAGVRGAARWRQEVGGELPVLLGRAAVPSSLVIEGDAAAHPELAARAAVLDDAPFAIDARGGIGLHGTAPTRRAALRSLTLQLAGALSPATTTIRVAGWDEHWLSALPHRVTREPGLSPLVEFRCSTAEPILIAEAAEAASIPHDCGVELELAGPVARVRADALILEGCRPELVSREQAASCATLLGGLGAELAAIAAEPPDRAVFAELTQPAAGRPGLSAAFAVGAIGPVELDLVRDGPHAIVGGTTGSGKSELLVSWLLAMAAERAPAELALLLVDFKGGASFAPIARLPHVVGLVTDLDARSAARALASLRAEVLRRERTLAQAGVREISALPRRDLLPRLVIAIDEFAAVQEGFDDLHRLVADLASRGRSLGIHLLLCTQRPAGVIRDAVFANVRLRLSLAVTSPADSTAVIGSDAAARLAGAPVGRVLVSIDGADATPAQVALVGRHDAERIAGRWADSPRPERPWCDELPRSIALDRLPRTEAGAAFGLLDLPERQSQVPAVWDPSQAGNLVVVGATGSGRSTALRALCATNAGRLAPERAEQAWDAVRSAVDAVRAGRPVGLVAVDDLDVILARLGPEHGPALVELLVEFARIGSAVGSCLAVAIRRVTPLLTPLIGVCEARLLLRMPDRHEHALAGGDPSHHDPDAPAGRGEWRGHAVQVGLVEGASPVWDVAAPSPLAFTEHSSVAVVTRRVREVADALSVHYAVTGLEGPARPELAADGRSAIVADPEAWQSAWAALAALRSKVAVVFHGCSTAEFRALSGDRRLPPPLGPGSDDAWILEPDGALGRVSLPRPAPRPAVGGAANAP